MPPDDGAVHQGAGAEGGSVGASCPDDQRVALGAWQAPSRASRGLAEPRRASQGLAGPRRS
eukprot:14175148-Alexandrium_andersonii.AAC.1